ncbi:hypothetical protein [Streptomyces sp. NPDC057582]|uniref:hypothetical protein n=1 Tax=Streptomyces sp. NPDC057582 TaxID=3346174 RepID=UPI00368E026A
MPDVTRHRSMRSEPPPGGPPRGPVDGRGGMWGYDYLIEILADPHHEEHEDRLA